ncbi:MAG: hypothetical protein KF709_11820 [Gemmatimonadaceae bacterium]|nr:hypothetical protein [Gemmatimonadaceae bacterium]
MLAALLTSLACSAGDGALHDFLSPGADSRNRPVPATGATFVAFRIAGRALPFAFPGTPSIYGVLTADSLFLRPDGTLTSSHMVIAVAMGTASPSPGTWEGSYTISGDTIHITHWDGSVTHGRFYKVGETWRLNWPKWISYEERWERR